MRSRFLSWIKLIGKSILYTSNIILIKYYTTNWNVQTVLLLFKQNFKWYFYLCTHQSIMLYSSFPTTMFHRLRSLTPFGQNEAGTWSGEFRLSKFAKVFLLRCNLRVWKRWESEEVTFREYFEYLSKLRCYNVFPRRLFWLETGHCREESALQS